MLNKINKFSLGTIFLSISFLMGVGVSLVFATDWKTTEKIDNPIDYMGSGRSFEPAEIRDIVDNLNYLKENLNTSSGADNMGNHSSTRNIRLNGYWLSGDGGSEGIKVSSSGRVGINRSSPSHKLHVYGNLRLESTSPTLVLTDTDHRSGMVHVNSNIMYFLRGCGTNRTDWCTTKSRWPLQLNLENNEAIFGGDVYSNAYLYNSDRRLKKNIQKLDNYKDILKINAVRFVWKRDGKKDVGIIAQEVQKYFPEFVKVDDRGMLSVDYPKLAVPMLNLLQEQEVHEPRAHEVILRQRY